MGFEPNLKSGEIIDNNKLMDIFQVGNSGGMRKSNTTNSLVLIFDHNKALYNDKWEENILHYTGMGRIGDQNLDYSQNRTLYESNENHINLFLFEVFNRNEYTFRGRVKLIDETYQEEQLDDNGNSRKVWVFPLRVFDDIYKEKLRKFIINSPEGKKILNFLKNKMKIY